MGVTRSPLASSMRCAQEVIAQLSSPTVATDAPPMRASSVASQRVRVTDWFQARRYVPVSSSRAISGAPQKMPIRAGTRYIAYVARSYTVPLVPLLASSRKFSIALVQLLPQPATLAASYASAMLRAVRTRRTASTARPPTVIQVWVRNWRQVNQIIALSPKRATGRGRPVTDKRGLGLRG